MRMHSTPALLLSLSLALPTSVSGEVVQEGPAPTDTIPQPWRDLHQGPYAEAHLRVEKRIRCDCGCNLDIHLCQAQMQCGTSPIWSQRILRLLEDGQSEEAILAGFVIEFGESVRMDLPMEGFNWIGYLTPWTAIIVAGGAFGVFFRMRTSRRAPVVTRSDLDPEELERIRADLERLEEMERDSGF